MSIRVFRSKQNVLFAIVLIALFTLAGLSITVLAPQQEEAKAKRKTVGSLASVLSQAGNG